MFKPVSLLAAATLASAVGLALARTEGPDQALEKRAAGAVYDSALDLAHGARPHHGDSMKGAAGANRQVERDAPLADPAQDRQDHR
ncbi:hypothetical protein [Pseudomonas panipatensis]|jgi:hypothetical protein|uniref:hypothetical protein n=1 Tax=Pseudomonas panipatensis TaxID=428992 RepID=UPI0035B48F88